jgi:hypothetical protein
MARAPSTLPPMSPMSRAMVLHRPRAQSSTPSLARKRSLGMLREMCPAVRSPFQNRLTRFSSPKTGSPPRLRYQEPASLPPLDTGSHPRLLPSNILEELPLHDRCPISLWHLLIVAREPAEPRPLITIAEVGTCDPGSLARVLALPLSQVLHFHLFL